MFESLIPLMLATTPTAGDVLMFDTAAAQIGMVDTFPGEERGASVACAGPVPGDLTFTRALVGLEGEPPARFYLDVWADDGASDYEPLFITATLESTEPVSPWLTLGVYRVPAVFVPSGMMVCVGAALDGPAPVAFFRGSQRTVARHPGFASFDFDFAYGVRP